MRTRKNSLPTSLKQYSTYLNEDLSEFVYEHAHKLRLTESAYLRFLVQEAKKNTEKSNDDDQEIKY